MLTLKNISLSYGQTPALDNINLSIGSGEIYSVLGPSGCGKTSLINILAGNLSHHTGQATLNGAGINHREKTIGLISQDYGLLPWRTAYKNIILPLKIKRLNVANYADKINYVMEKLDIADLKNRYPISLSGGQKQRLAIAGAFIMDLDLLLMDEPFSALDQVTRETTQELFFHIWKDTRPTAVFVTHSIEEAVFLGQKVVLLSKSPGHIIKIVDNPTFGQSDVRLSREFLSICGDIRETIKSEWDNKHI